MSDRVTIVGLGLMGGSLARALKALRDPPFLTGVEHDPIQASLAHEAGAIDLIDLSGEEGLGTAELIVYATPLGATLTLLGDHAPFWGKGSVVTDLVSVKAPILRRMRGLGEERRYVGAHPMCGGERSGFSASREDLFRGVRSWLVADDGVSAEVRERVERFWASVGALPEWVDAEEHDRTMAWASHLPQLVSNALAGALDAAGIPRSGLGPGGRDMTRLAASSPEMWKELLEASATPLGPGLTSVSKALGVLADLLARREMDRIAEFMERTREWALEPESEGDSEAESDR